MQLKITLSGDRPAGATPGYYDASMTTPVEASVDLSTDNVTAIAETAETFLVRELGVPEMPAAAALREKLRELSAENDRLTENAQSASDRAAKASRTKSDDTDALTVARGLLTAFEKMLAGQGVRRPAGFTRDLKTLRGYLGTRLP